MSEERQDTHESTTTTPPSSEAERPKKINWAKVSFIANIVLIAGILIALGAAEVIHQSNTNPNLCGLCHIMRPHVESYLTSNYLDNIHQQAGVECKDCHDYPIPAEIASAVRYVTGSYVVTEEGVLPKRTLDEEMCTRCHISLEHVAQSTDFLWRNPHNAPTMGEYACLDCHVSHGEQIDVCGECHDNGGQRLIGRPITPRGTIGGPQTGG